MSEALSLGLSLLSGNLIKGACGFTTCTTLLAEAILLPIVTPEQGPYLFFVCSGLPLCRLGYLLEAILRPALSAGITGVSCHA